MISAFLVDVVTVGSLAFWLWYGLWFTILTVLHRKHQFFTGLMVGVLAINHVRDPSILWRELDTTLCVIGGYIALGTVWSLFRWYRFQVGLRRKYDARKEQFLREHVATTFLQEKISLDTNLIPPDLIIEWRRRNPDGNPKDYAMSRYTSKILTWMVFWPLSMLDWVLDDLATRVFQLVFDVFRGVYARILNHIWGDVSDDFTFPKDRQPPNE